MRVSPSCSSPILVPFALHSGLLSLLALNIPCTVNVVCEESAPLCCLSCFGQSRPIVLSLLTETDPAQPSPTFVRQHTLSLSQIPGLPSSASVWVSRLLRSVFCPWRRQVKVCNAFGWRKHCEIDCRRSRKWNSQCPTLCVFVWSCWFVSIGTVDCSTLIFLASRNSLRFCKNKKTQMCVVFCLVEAEIVSWSFEIQEPFRWSLVIHPRSAFNLTQLENPTPSSYFLWRR